MNRICLPEYECTPKCHSVVHGAQVVSAITRQNDLAVLAYIRSLCYNCALVHDSFGRTALHMAAMCGRKQVLNWLLKHGHANCNVRDWESGWTALHRSIFYGQLVATKILIENGANLFSPDFEGLTPLDLIVKDRLSYVDYSSAPPSEVYIWGSNSNFNLGYENQQSKSNPEIVEYFRREKLNIKQISMSKYHTVFLTADGQVYSCGHGHGGRLGHDSEQTCIAPKKIKMPSPDECIQIATGMDHTVILTKNGTVWTCGLNTYHQLGHSPAPERLLSPKAIKYLKNHSVKVEGICAARFHSVVFSSDAIYTFGLNGGQLGHLKGEKTQINPQQVTSLNLRDTAIICVTVSDGATVCATDKGDVYVLHEYHCRKVASKQLNIQKVAVIGGHLDAKLDVSVLKEKGGHELTIFILNKTGQVLLWRESSTQLVKCSFNLKHQLNITYLALNQTSFILLTVSGEGFTGTYTPKKETNMKPGTGDILPSTKKDKKAKDEQALSNNDNYSNRKDKKDSLITDMARLSIGNTSFVKGGSDTTKTVAETASFSEKGAIYEMFHIKRLTNIHRGTLAASDPKGRNFAVIQAHPSYGVLDFPEVVEDSAVNEHYTSLLETADVYDSIHDVIVQIRQRQFAAHKFILASRVEYFSKHFLLQKSSSEPNTVVKIDGVHPEIFAQLLKYIYTGSCDFFRKGFKLPFISADMEEKLLIEKETNNSIYNKSAFSVVGGKKKTVNKQKKNVVEDPVSMLQEAAKKFNINSLAKQLDHIRHSEGVINEKSVVPPTNKLKFDRKKHPHLHDICILSEDGAEIWCHKCILTARLEYFHSMLAYSWIETSTNAPLALSFPANILEILIDYLYTGDSPDLFSCDDVEMLLQVLIMADQLLVSHLKQICEKSLAYLITLKNAAELLEFSNVYRAKQLQNTCMEFISINLPAILENKTLSVVSDDAIDKLTEFYRTHIPVMEYRRITPYFDSPQEDEMKSIAENLPFSPDESWSEENINVDYQNLKKQKVKRKPRSRKSSSSEVKMSPQYHEPFNSEILSDTEPENLDTLEESIITASAVFDKKIKPTSPIAIPQRKSHNEDLKSPVFSSETYTSEYSSSCELHNTSSSDKLSAIPWSSPQCLDKSVDLKQIMSQQQQQQQKLRISENRSEFRKSTKLSQKQRKKLAAENQNLQLPKEIPVSEEKVSAPRNPWAKTVSPTESWSLKDIMEAEENVSKHLETKRVSVTKQLKNKDIPLSPSVANNENPWQSIPEKKASDTVPNFVDILKEEQKQNKNFVKVQSKPLHLIQLEDQAIEELLKYYNAADNPDEQVHVVRIMNQNISTPIWKANNRTGSNKHF